jgi:UDP-glucose 4-epimerase
VIHMAASSLVGESVQQPARYYHNNVVTRCDAHIRREEDRLLVNRSGLWRT